MNQLYENCNTGTIVPTIYFFIIVVELNFILLPSFYLHKHCSLLDGTTPPLPPPAHCSGEPPDTHLHRGRKPQYARRSLHRASADYVNPGQVNPAQYYLTNFTYDLLYRKHQSVLFSADRNILIMLLYRRSLLVYPFYLLYFGAVF